MELLETGKIVNTHGLRGDVKIQGWCDSLEFLLEFDNFYLENGEKLVVKSSQIHKNILLARFEGYEDINKAEKLKNQIIYIDRDETELDEGEYFIADLIGCNLYNIENGKLLGEIYDVLQTGANDVYAAKNSVGNEIFIPVIPDVVKNIDIENKKIEINIIPGLLD